jgi:hypothetical protein
VHAATDDRCHYYHFTLQRPTTRASSAPDLTAMLTADFVGTVFVPSDEGACTQTPRRCGGASSSVVVVVPQHRRTCD